MAKLTEDLTTASQRDGLTTLMEKNPSVDVGGIYSTALQCHSCFAAAAVV